MTRRTVGCAVVGMGHRIMVGAHWITAAHLQPPQRTKQHHREPLGDLDEAPERSLGAGGRRVDADTADRALDRLR